MSAWERSRYIPWDRIPQDPNNLEEQKERIFRDLHRQTIMSNPPAAQSETPPAEAAAPTGSSGRLFQSKIPFSSMDLLRQAAFGGCIGSITGAVFGFMDGMRTAGESAVLQKASHAAKARYLLQGTTRSATLLGVFFAGFHSVKYGLKVALDPGDLAEMGGAAAVSLGALAAQPALRAAMPYATMLIIMDGVSQYMRRS